MGPCEGGKTYKGSEMMTLLYAAILLGVLVFVHELGHFLLAKLLGVKVLKFSLGFGQRVVGKTYGDTEYCISSIPLGGFVKMLGEEPGEEIPESERQRAYSSQPVWKRFLIVFSGPLFNLVFAVLVFLFVFIRGVPVPFPDIGKIDADSPAARAGFMTGDRVIEINGRPVENWTEVETLVAENEGQRLTFKVKRDGQTLDLSVVPVRKVEKTIFGEDKAFGDIGTSPLMYPVVGEVVRDGRAEKAGVRKGDRILEIEGIPLKTWQDMTEVIHGNPGKPLMFKIWRSAKVLEMTIVPEKKTIKIPGGGEKEIGLIGIGPMGNDFMKSFGPIAAFSLGVRKTWDISVLTLVSIVKLVQRVLPADTIGGPIMIAQMAGEQASRGAVNFLNLMAVISINLGILNLLPIPILDGGHLMFLAVESVRRKALSEKVMVFAQRVGLAFLVTLMAFALYNDILRWITGKMLP